MSYTLDGEPTTVAKLKAEFSAYGMGLIREGLRAGHATREELLQFLVTRELKAAHSGGRKPNSTRPLVYSRKPRG